MASDNDSTADSNTLTTSQTQHVFRETLALLQDIDEQWINGGRLAHPADQHLAYRALMMVVSGAIEFFLEADTARPTFNRVTSPIRKWGDNPDNLPYFALIDGQHSYRIRGKKGQEVYQSFTVHDGDREGHWPKGVASDINHTDIHYEHDGTYEIILSPVKRGKNWLKLSPDSGSIIARFYFATSKPVANSPELFPQFTIETLDPPKKPPASLTDDEVALRLGRIKNWIHSKFGYQLMPDPKHLNLPGWYSDTINQLGDPVEWGQDQQEGGWGAVDIAYSAGNYRLEDNEILIMEGRLPKATFVNVVIWNHPFGQTQDYRYRQVSLNAAQIETDNNGNFKIILAHSDPGEANWLDTARRKHGTIYWRYLLPGEPPVKPTIRIEKSS